MSESESVGSVSATTTQADFEWTINHCFSLLERLNENFDSPTFTFLGCSWNLRLLPKAMFTRFPIAHPDADIPIYLYLCMDKASNKTTVTFSLGIKTSDGSLHMQKPLNHTFQERQLVTGYEVFKTRHGLQENKSTLVPSDTLTLICRMEKSASCPVKMSPEPLRLLELETLSSRFEQLFISQIKCDTTVKVKGKEFPAHRAVLMAQSSVFSAMFQHELSESESGVVTVEDCDPDSFGVFLHYLYTGKLEGLSFENARHLYVTADKYDVQELKSFCTTYMMENLTAENVCAVVTLADQYEDTFLSRTAQGFFNRNAAEIFLTAEWETLLKGSYRLANKLLKEMTKTKSYAANINE